MSAKLNENEKLVLEAIRQNAQDCSGGAFAIGGEIATYVHVHRLEPSQVAGYISSLKRKGFISVDGPAAAVDSQITIRRWPDGSKYMMRGNYR